MKLNLFTLASISITTVLSASTPTAELYILPSTNSNEGIKLNGIEFNSLLSHKLGITEYELLPNSLMNNQHFQHLLSSTGSSSSESSGSEWLTETKETKNQKIIILLECGKQGCEG